MFVVYNDVTGAFVQTVCVANVRPREDGEEGCEIRQLDDAEILLSPIGTVEMFSRLSAQ